MVMKKLIAIFITFMLITKTHCIINPSRAEPGSVQPVLDDKKIKDGGKPIPRDDDDPDAIDEEFQDGRRRLAAVESLIPGLNMTEMPKKGMQHQKESKFSIALSVDRVTTSRNVKNDKEASQSMAERAGENQVDVEDAVAGMLFDPNTIQRQEFIQDSGSDIKEADADGNESPSPAQEGNPKRALLFGFVEFSGGDVAFRLFCQIAFYLLAAAFVVQVVVAFVRFSREQVRLQKSGGAGQLTGPYLKSTEPSNFLFIP